MRDPDPSNIAGRKVESHSVEWHINLSHVIVAAGALYLVWRLGLLTPSSDGREDEREGTPIDVQGVAQEALSG
jgi:hypothetical protein